MVAAAPPRLRLRLLSLRKPRGSAPVPPASGASPSVRLLPSSGSRSSRLPRRLFLGLGASLLDGVARMASPRVGGPGGGGDGGGGRSLTASARPRQGASPVEQVLMNVEWPEAFPFKDEDFSRFDESPDSFFYSEPRFVTHIDDPAINALSKYYSNVFPPSDTPGVCLLDLCSSWVSHYPPGYRQDRIVGMGMNEEELKRNPVLTEYIVQDLNVNPKLPFDDNSFDIITNVRTHEGLPVLGEIDPPSEARMIYEPEKSLKDIPGHLRQLLLQREHFPVLPGRFRFGKPSWLAPLLAKVVSTARGHLHQWKLTQLLIFAKRYEKIQIHWEALSALVEIWHPQTHTFLFPNFEASILLEETELFLGLNRTKVANDMVAHSMKVVDTMNFLSQLTGDRLQARNITCASGIRLSILAKWTMEAKDQGKPDETIAQVLSLCLAGLLLFPSQDAILDHGQIGTMRSAWQGKSLAQLVLAYLYSGLTSARMGRPFYGCAILLDIWLSFHVKMDFNTNDSSEKFKTYENTSIYVIRHALHFSETMVIKTLKLRSREDWCKFFVYFPRAEFIFSSEALIKLQLKTRPCQGVDLRLVGSNELVLYNAHRCYLQLGQPRHVIPQLSHHSPIESRVFNTYHDQVNVRTCLELWKISKPHQVEMTYIEEDQQLLKTYILWIRKLRCIEF